MFRLSSLRNICNFFLKQKARPFCTIRNGYWTLGKQETSMLDAKINKIMNFEQMQNSQLQNLDFQAIFDLLVENFRRKHCICIS